VLRAAVKGTMWLGVEPFEMVAACSVPTREPPTRPFRLHRKVSSVLGLNRRQSFLCPGGSSPCHDSNSA